jgi:hypothetical protein
VHPEPSSTATITPTQACATSPAPLFPPRDADADTYRAWLARAAWPEVVFGARVPSATG